MVKNTVLPIALQAVTGTTLLNTFLPLNNADLTGAPFLLRINNTTDENVVISFDGVIDNDVVLSQTVLEIYTQANSLPNGYTALFSKSIRVYVRAESTIPSLGSVTISGYYQPN